MKRSQVLSWCLFDFANSTFAAVIMTVVFPVYFVNVIVGNEAGLGDLWWGRAVSASMAFVALTSPFIGGIVDYGGFRKRLLISYTTLAVIMAASLALLEPGMAVMGFFLIFLANIGMEGGVVFYNSYLPEIANKGYRGRVSAWGFSLGYLGSMISLVITIPLVKIGSYDLLWIITALFFLLFSMPAFIFLPGDKNLKPIKEAALSGFKQTFKTFKEVWSEKRVRGFLLSFFLYQDGVNTVIVFSGIFASTTLNFQQNELVYLFLTIQITALMGAFIMAKPIDTWGAKKVIVLSLFLWSSVTACSYFVETKSTFIAVAVIAGLGLGTVQAASRAFFTEFIPEGKESEYFGVYSFLGKTSSILGPVLFGVMSHTFKSQRPAVLSITLFFVAGLFFLMKVKQEYNG